MNLFYHFGLWLYRLIVRLISPFHEKAACFTKGRNGLIRRIKEQVSNENPIVWFHCASLGEFEQGYPIMEGYRRIHPEHKIILTFFSPSGYEVKKGDGVADWIFYLPLDTRRNARRFLDAVKPAKAIFVKYEFWHNYLITLRKRNIPTYIISATFHPSQPFFKWYGAFFRKMLRSFTLLFVQDQDSVTLLEQIEVTHVAMAGDTRFDRVLAQAQLPCLQPVIEAFCTLNHTTNTQRIIVAGSTWPRDESLLEHLLDAYNEVKLILVPHEVDNVRILSVMDQFARFHPVRYSQLSNIESIPIDSKVMVVDTIGLLFQLYRFGSITYVGGGFEDGIHNIIEAAVYGVPVVFGPRYQKFVEAVDLVGLGGGFSVKTPKALAALVGKWLTLPQTCAEAGQVCARYVQGQIGATKVILSRL